MLHTFGGDFTITIGVILTRTLHQEALTARVVHWQRVQLVIIFGANPNTHAHETRVRIKAFVRKERHAVTAIAVLIITAPGRNGNVINKDIAIVIIGFNGQFSIGGTHRQFAQLIHLVRIEIVGLRNISATSRYLHAASLASNRRQARDLHTSRTRGVCSNLPNRTSPIIRRRHHRHGISGNWRTVIVRARRRDTINLTENRTAFSRTQSEVQLLARSIGHQDFL